MRAQKSEKHRKISSGIFALLPWGPQSSGVDISRLATLVRSDNLRKQD